MNVPRKELRKQLSLHQLFTLSFGTIVGVGWITVMGFWLGQAGSAGAIPGFIVGGVIMLVIGVCYAEVAAMFPVSGGEIAYTFEMFGTRLSFAVGWSLAFVYISTTAFEAISVGWVLSALIPGFGGPVIYTAFGSEVHAWALGAGLLMMWVITVINHRGAKLAASFQHASGH